MGERERGRRESKRNKAEDSLRNMLSDVADELTWALQACCGRKHTEQQQVKMYSDEMMGRHLLRNREDSIDEMQTDIDMQSLKCIEELENEDWHSKYRTTRAHDDRPVGFFAIDPGMASRSRVRTEQVEPPRAKEAVKETSR
eukprot:513075-Hanusia_phi.AAC.1